MQSLQAHAVAYPLLRRFPARASGRVIGRSPRAAYALIDGTIVAVTPRGVPLMPNGVAIGVPAIPSDPATGAAIEPGRLRLGALRVSWNPEAPPRWDPRVTVRRGAGAGDLRRLGTALLDRAGLDLPSPDPVGDTSLETAVPALLGLLAALRPCLGGDTRGVEGLSLLLQAVATRSPELAGRAAGKLAGLGPGLTPEGDDVLASAAATVVAAGPSVGFARHRAAAWLGALAPPSLWSRTTALSATLLELAIQGEVTEPLRTALDPEAVGPLRWNSAVERLLGIGHSTGLAYAVGAGATALLLGSGGP